jgi:hypothetical protein
VIGQHRKAGRRWQVKVLQMPFQNHLPASAVISMFPNVTLRVLKVVKVLQYKYASFAIFSTSNWSFDFGKAVTTT